MSTDLAGRFDRLVARIIDIVIFIALAILAAPFGDQAVIQVIIFLAAIAYIIVQIVLLTNSGQSIGKKVMKIKIIKTETNTNGGFVPNVLLREIVNGLLGIIPFYSLVDVLLIFREDRRCIHDFIAGTTVVKA
jgi:uncharacterized RDD family membrane protein YckC